MSRAKLTVEEASCRARAITVDSYEIALDLSDAATSATFRSVTEIRFDHRDAAGSIFLDLQAAHVEEVVLDGRVLDPAEVFRRSRVELAGMPAGHHVLNVVADCRYTNTGEGLHRFVDAADHEIYLYSHFQVADASRVFACFDQPDLKARFRFTVEAPSTWTVISNTRGSATPSRRTGTSVWSFPPTPRLSTYVVSVAAGPYHAVHSTFRTGDRSIPLGLYCRPALADALDADEIFAVTRLGLTWFQEIFDSPYPFEKYDHVFVPEFNAGAMENAAAVTIKEKYIPRARVTDAALHSRAVTVLHEMAHMWFGDLVTMRWWDDLWLNESFATYCSYACLAFAPESRWADSWTTFANQRKAKAYRQDQLSSTHPVKAEIHELDDIRVNFDGITYSKGASVLKQLVAHVGTDVFFGGVRSYLKAHAYGNATLTDLVQALAAASGRDLRTWAKLWLETSGVNVLRPEIETDADGLISSFRIRQEAVPLPPGARGDAVLRPHRIAVGCYHLDGPTVTLMRRRQLEVDVAAEEVTDLPEVVGLPRPDVVLLNDDDLSYAKIRFDALSLRTVMTHVGAFTDSLPRAICFVAAWDMTRDGELAARDYLRLVLAGIGGETDIGVLESLHRQVALALDQYTEPTWRPHGMARWSAAALDLLRAAQPGTDQQHAWARAFISASHTDDHLDLLVALLNGAAAFPGLVVDAELRWAIVRRLAARGRAGEPEIAAEQRRDTTTAGECHAAAARAARPEAPAKAAAWEAVMGGGDLTNSLQQATIEGFAEACAPTLLAPYLERYFQSIESIWEGSGYEMARQIVIGLFPAAQGRAAVDATDVWLDDHRHSSAALRRLVAEQRDELKRSLRAQSVDRVSHTS